MSGSLQDVELGDQNKDPALAVDSNAPARADDVDVPAPLGPPRVAPAKSDDEGEAEHEAAEELFSKVSSGRESMARRTVRTLLGTAFVIIMIFLPAFVVWSSAIFPEYEFSEVRLGSMYTNAYMEYLRYCLFLALALITYDLVDWLVWCVPKWAVWLLNGLGQPPSAATKRRLYYMSGAHFWIVVCIWIVAMAIVGGSLLYRTTFLGTVKSGLFGAAPKTAAAALQALAPVKDLAFYFERTILVLLVYFALRAAGKYLTELIAINFHQMAFGERVSSLNYRFQVITKLYGSVKRPEEKKVQLASDVGDAHLLPDRMGELGSEKKAQDLADDLFQRMVPSNREYLTIDDFTNYFEQEDLEEAFKVFDRIGNGDPSGDEIREAILEVYKERRAVERGLANNHSVVKKLDSLIMQIVIFFTLTFAIPIFELGAAAIMVIFGILWTAVGYLFQNTAKTVFESVVFVFVEHAFDLGDRVVVDNEYLTVERVEIFTTIFRRWDGTAVYIPNANLANKNIYNIRRSLTQSDQIDVALAGDTSIQRVWELRDKLAEFTQSEPKDFMGPLSIMDFIAEDGKVKLQLLVEYRSNFQDAAVRAARRNKFMAMLKQVVADLGIEYYP